MADNLLFSLDTGDNPYFEKGVTAQKLKYLHKGD